MQTAASVSAFESPTRASPGRRFAHADATLARVRQLAAALAENVEPIRKQARRERLTHPIVGRLCALLAARAQHCFEALG
jgi:hypothetical protein